MTSIFIGGSRAISKLNDALRARFDDFMRRGCTIFIGDASGADRIVQQYFAQSGYSRVVVYCMDRCRNNIGGWPAKKISGPSGPRDFAYYAIKDRAMADDASCGVMLWDGESKGTLNNIQNLLAAGKKTLVYFSPEESFHKIETQDDLGLLLAHCDPNAIVTAQRKIERAAVRQETLSLR